MSIEKEFSRAKRRRRRKSCDCRLERLRNEKGVKGGKSIHASYRGSRRRRHEWSVRFKDVRFGSFQHDKSIEIRSLNMLLAGQDGQILRRASNQIYIDHHHSLTRHTDHGETQCQSSRHEFCLKRIKSINKFFINRYSSSACLAMPVVKPIADRSVRLAGQSVSQWVQLIDRSIDRSIVVNANF